MKFCFNFFVLLLGLACGAFADFVYHFVNPDKKVETPIVQKQEVPVPQPVQPQIVRTNAYTNIPIFNLGDTVIVTQNKQAQVGIVWKVCQVDSDDHTGFTWKYNVMCREKIIQCPDAIIKLYKRFDWNVNDPCPDIAPIPELAPPQKMTIPPVPEKEDAPKADLPNHPDKQQIA